MTEPLTVVATLRDPEAIERFQAMRTVARAVLPEGMCPDSAIVAAMCRCVYPDAASVVLRRMLPPRGAALFEGAGI